jgi:hypothetical protein
MPREDDNDMGVEMQFFTSRSRIKKPKAQKIPPPVPVANPIADLIPTLKKKRGRGIGNAYQHTKTGARADLGGVVARSSWEADVMRTLQLFKIAYEFEPTVFTFPADARGKMSAYLPDIYLPKFQEYIEVKGMLDGRGRAKLRKFKKHYPEEFKKLTVIISKSNKANKLFFKKLGVENILYYEHIVRLFADKIINWEGKKK